VLGGNRSIDGKYDRLEAHGIYWTISENDPTTAPLYNFGKGRQALYRGPQGQKQMAVSVRWSGSDRSKFGPARTTRMNDRTRVRELNLDFASWNQIGKWLRRVEALRDAA
jgi:hypothetical protein